MVQQFPVKWLQNFCVRHAQCGVQCRAEGQHLATYVYSVPSCSRESLRAAVRVRLVRCGLRHGFKVAESVCIQKYRWHNLSSRMTKFGFSCFGSRWSCVFPLHSSLFCFEEWQDALMPHGQSLSDKEIVSYPINCRRWQRAPSKRWGFSHSVRNLGTRRTYTSRLSSSSWTCRVSPNGNPKAADKSRIAIRRFSKIS